MLLKNVSPIGALWIQGYGEIEHGSVFAPKPEDVEGLIGQVDNFDTADSEAAEARAAHLSTSADAQAAYDAANTASTQASPSEDVAPDIEKDREDF